MELEQDLMVSERKKKPFRWHVLVFLAPAVIIYTMIMILPLAETLRFSFFQRDTTTQVISFVGLENYIKLFFDPYWVKPFLNSLWNNCYFFLIHMLVQNPIGVLIAALLSMGHLPGKKFYRTAIFMPTLLSFVVVGFVWKLMLSPLWGVSKGLMKSVGVGSWYLPFLGKEETALTTLSLISVWQFIGIPMMLIYAALLSIPDEVIEAAECDGVTGISQFFKIKLVLILPTIGIISILTFVGNFNAFDLIYTTQGPLAGPNFSTDLLGTILYRTFYGQQLQPGDPNMGAAIATVMFFIILMGVAVYLFFIQRKLTRYEM
ncbi:sn-glycerol-3-phosphate transport system permease protein UgpA [Pseudovibrio sp. W64]|uniref:carbohydrate ABC transporter permease n=1 Tax=Pseudovibrio sp. W64 TaxID=1735583 RepID=UPI0007B2523C|nr:sugar ABC transporter permease [Pseudovibrio sp. W64]KZK75338.1 sn-glycerol-3-phosphate transport system permease protein UgpA [Pseudovibrio sp. W64]